MSYTFNDIVFVSKIAFDLIDFFFYNSLVGLLASYQNVSSLNNIKVFHKIMRNNKTAYYYLNSNVLDMHLAATWCYDRFIFVVIVTDAAYHRNY